MASKARSDQTVASSPVKSKPAANGRARARVTVMRHGRH